MANDPWAYFPTVDPGSAAEIAAPAPADAQAPATAVAPAPDPWSAFPVIGAAAPDPASAVPADPSVTDPRYRPLTITPQGSAAPAPMQLQPATGPGISYIDPEGTGQANYDTTPDPRTDAQRAQFAAQATIDGVPFSDRAIAGVQALTGNGSYAGDLAAQRAAYAARMLQDPAAENVFSTIGSSALPAGAVGDVVKGGSLLANVGRGAIAGGLIGGAQGASATPDLTNAGQAAKNTGSGAGFGALVGGALPAMGQGAGALYSKFAGDVVPAVQGLGTASRNMFLDAIGKEGPDAVAAMQAAYGDPGMLIDYGPSLRGIGQGLATKDGTAASTVINAVGSRQAATNQRIQQGLAQNFGPAQDPQLFAQGLAGERAQISGMLPRVFAAAPPIDLSSAFARIDGGLQTAVGSERDALLQAHNLLTQPHPLDPSTRVPISNAAQVDKARQELDDLIDYNTNNPLAPPSSAIRNAQGAVQGVRGAVSDALKQQAPGYQLVMDSLSNRHAQRNAVNFGRESLQGGQDPMWPSSFAPQFQAQAVQPRVQDATRLGQRSVMEEAIGTKPNDQLAVKQLFQTGNTPGYTAPGVTPGNPDLSGWNAQKLATSFGHQPVASMQELLNANDAFNDTFNKVAQNSESARRLHMAKALEDADWKPWVPFKGSASEVTPTGMILEPARRAANLVAGAFQGPVSTAARDAELAAAGTAQGDARNRLLAELLMAAPARQGNNELRKSGQAVTMYGGAVTANALARALRGESPPAR